VTVNSQFIYVMVSKLLFQSIAKGVGSVEVSRHLASIVATQSALRGVFILPMRTKWDQFNVSDPALLCTTFLAKPPIFRVECYGVLATSSLSIGTDR